MVGRMPLPIYPCIPLLEGMATSRAFRGDQEITPLANRSCTAATVESPLDFRIMNGEQGDAETAGPCRAEGRARLIELRGRRTNMISAAFDLRDAL